MEIMSDISMFTQGHILGTTLQEMDAAEIKMGITS
jgi:hypothetical protein